MALWYEVWDRETGNCVDVCGTLAMARRTVATVAARDGAEAARALTILAAAGGDARGTVRRWGVPLRRKWWVS